MTPETLKKANELTKNINLASQEINLMKNIYRPTIHFVSFENQSISVDQELLKKIIDIATDHKKRQVDSWKKELKEL